MLRLKGATCVKIAGILFAESRVIMKKILVPTDFSEIAHNAGKYALQLARAFNKELMFFHAGADENQDNLTKLQNEANKVLLSDPLRKIYYMVTSRPFNSETVNNVVSLENIRLIVMGTTGEGGGLTKKLFGGNTRVVLENADCPVMAIPAGYKFSGIRTINYASDLSNIDQEVSRVISFARAFNSEIVIFHVSPIFSDLGDVEKIDMRAKIEEIKSKFLYDAVRFSVEKMAHDNEINNGIVLFLERNPADLLIMFHNKTIYFDKLFSSSYSGSITSHLNIPFLVFPKL